MGTRLVPLLRPLGGDERGASVIELGLFAPVLALMVMGISDIAMSYATKLRLEQAAYTALEKVAVGSVQTDYDFLRTDAARAGDVAEADVTVDAWLECDGVRQADFAGVCPDGEMISRYVRVTIDSGYTPTFDYGPLAAAARDDGSIPVTASAAVRIQ
jgi:hypothetical protein